MFGPERFRGRYRGCVTNEVDRTNILASGFRGFEPSRNSILLPAFTVFLWRQPYRLHNQRTAGARLPLQRLAHGKSYPVTAAQLLPIRTGFLAPIQRIKLTKN
jgi:hypothetical protein